MKNNKKLIIKKNGVTLIALVITIVILIILTGVLITTTLGSNGLFTKAKMAKNQYLNAQASEEEQLEALKRKLAGEEEDLPENTNDTPAGTKVKIPSNWQTETVNYIKTANGEKTTVLTKVATVYAVSVGGGETVPVPYGFYYVGGTLSSGVVISDNILDKDKYAGTADLPAGAAYNADGTVNTTAETYIENETTYKTIKGNQFVWIPCTTNSSDTSKIQYEKTNWGYNNAAWDTETNPAEYNQIDKYGGFYIGRFEAGIGNISLSTNINFSAANTASEWINDSFSIRDGLSHTYSGAVASKAGEIPYYHADYYTSVRLANGMYKNVTFTEDNKTYNYKNYINSGLISGTMWDVMLKFIAGNDDTVVKANSYWGNYNASNANVSYTAGKGRYALINSSNGAMSSAFTVADSGYHYGIRTCASTEDVGKKNLYDVAGNLWEWTTENMCYSGNGLFFAQRGGSFDSAYGSGPVCYRNAITASYTSTHRGFRVALFIK